MSASIGYAEQESETPSINRCHQSSRLPVSGDQFQIKNSLKPSDYETSIINKRIYWTIKTTVPCALLRENNPGRVCYRRVSIRREAGKNQELRSIENGKLLTLGKPISNGEGYHLEGDSFWAGLRIACDHYSKPYQDHNLTDLQVKDYKRVYKDQNCLPSDLNLFFDNLSLSACPGKQHINYNHPGQYIQDENKDSLIVE